jgi:hypothetical protein
MSLAQLWQQGKRVEACALLAPIYGWFSEGFDTADTVAPVVLRAWGRWVLCPRTDLFASLPMRRVRAGVGVEGGTEHTQTHEALWTHHA